MATSRLGRHACKAVAATVYTSWQILPSSSSSHNTSSSRCDDSPSTPSVVVSPITFTEPLLTATTTTTTPKLNNANVPDTEKASLLSGTGGGGGGRMDTAATGEYYGLFPKRQLWQPTLEYPLWDTNWDGRRMPTTGNTDDDRRAKRKLRKEGVTRHIILIRHGQYTENERLDENRVLTELGRKQANLTGKRLKEMIDGVEGSDEFTGCSVRVVRVSNMARAKETADIIASHLGPDVTMAKPDADLNEGRPSHNLPAGDGYVSQSTIESTDKNHPRIEQAFHKYFYRADPPNTNSTTIIKTLDGDESSDDGIVDKKENGVEKGDVNSEQSTEEKQGAKHEFEIIVCHANIIRYFLCRALQLPPEAWLRLCTFNCSLTYLTIRPTGTVSCRMLGDVGHLPYGMTTFSMHPGFNW